MFFEGTEKKLQVIFKPDTLPLRAMDSSFWQKVVNAANAAILSSITNEHCDAYLLSESSLFVWDDRLTLITCGETTLVNSAIELFKYFNKNNIQSLMYQRQNEFRSVLQQTSFKQDVEVLLRYISGQAIQIGHLDGHHHHFFSSFADIIKASSNNIFELKMYNIGGKITDYLLDENCDSDGVRIHLNIHSLFSGFKIDDFIFEPFGYSINGLQDEKYFTIHVTPQSESSYASFETNIDLTVSSLNIIATLLDIFKPVSWDIISFNNKHTSSSNNNWKLAESAFSLSNGGDIHYENFHKPETQILLPTFI